MRGLGRFDVGRVVVDNNPLPRAMCGWPRRTARRTRRPWMRPAARARPRRRIGQQSHWDQALERNKSMTRSPGECLPSYGG